MSVLNDVIHPRQADYAVGATPSTGPFDIPFPFFDDDQVRVFIDGVETALFSITKASEFSTEGNFVTLENAVSNATVLVYSDTLPIRTSTSQLDQPSASREFDRLYAMNQEFRERVFLIDETGSVDANGGRIANLGDPVNAQDAVTKAFGDANYGGTAAAQALSSASAAAISAGLADSDRLAAQAAASAAAASEAAAAASASAAAASLTSFQGVYLGAFAAPPTGSFATGAFYFNTTDNAMYVRNLAGQWIAAPRGADGADGPAGQDGADGQNGLDATAPVGTVCYFLGTVAPSGYLEIAGQEIDNTYPELRQHIIDLGSPWGTSPQGHPYLDDVRGKFIRSLDNGAGVDIGRVLGSEQPDEFRSHTHGIFFDSSPNGSGQSVIQGTPSADTNPVGRSVGFAGGGETRPINHAYLAVVKAWDFVNVSGTIVRGGADLIQAIDDATGSTDWRTGGGGGGTASYPSFTGNTGRVLMVNGTEDGVEWGDGTPGPKGDPGNDGLNGADGADGRTVLSGGANPTTEGANGDFYINTATNTLFGPKTGGAWGAGTSLVGPSGSDGADGSNGTNGLNGSDGADGVDGRTILSGSANPTSQGADGDFYINTTSNTLFGPKTAGAWGLGTSLVGPAGQDGADGTNGTNGLDGADGADWDGKETIHALTGTSVALSQASGTIKTHALTGNTTYTNSLTNGQSLSLFIEDGAGFTVTWPTMTWLNNAGAAPSLAATGYTAVVLTQIAGTLYGFLAGDGT